MIYSYSVREELNPFHSNKNQQTIFHLNINTYVCIVQSTKRDRVNGKRITIRMVLNETTFW